MRAMGEIRRDGSRSFCHMAWIPVDNGFIREDGRWFICNSSQAIFEKGCQLGHEYRREEEKELKKEKKEKQYLGKMESKFEK
jgi:hypothetical protein